MKILPPNTHPDEDARDTCPVPNCGRDLTDSGECPKHGGESDWRKLAEESRPSFIRDEYLDEEDDQ